MANLDTAAKRASGYNFGLPFRRALPWPGTEPKWYRQHVLNLYSGILAIKLDLPDGRMAIVLAQGRSYPVAEEERVLIVVAQLRAAQVESESRVTDIAPAGNSHSVAEEDNAMNIIISLRIHEVMGDLRTREIEPEARRQEIGRESRISEVPRRIKTYSILEGE
jgi:hypothetical protein